LPAKDAVKLDTTYMTADEAFAAALSVLESKGLARRS
jgi:cytidylate kinase